jgi:RNA polymerase sigma-70 factor (ECF subfamily)
MFLGLRSRTEERGAEFVRHAHDAHADFVFKTLQRCGIRDADLEDLTQEVFLVVSRKHSTYDRTVKLTTWLYGIAIRVASEHRRRAWVRREQPSDTIPDVASDDSPENALDHADNARCLAAILDSLDVEARAVFVMFEIEEMSAPEIAELSGVPLGTVHSRLHYARKRFEAAATRARRRAMRGPS